MSDHDCYWKKRFENLMKDNGGDDEISIICCAADNCTSPESMILVGDCDIDHDIFEYCDGCSEILCYNCIHYEYNCPICIKNIVWRME